MDRNKIKIALAGAKLSERCVLCELGRKATTRVQVPLASRDGFVEMSQEAFEKISQKLSQRFKTQ